MLKEIICQEKKIVNDKAVISTTINETFSAFDLQHRITLISQEMSNIINQMKIWKSKYDELKGQKEDLETLLSQIEQSQSILGVVEDGKQICELSRNE